MQSAGRTGIWQKYGTGGTHKMEWNAEKILEAAEKRKAMILADRRALHSRPEVGAQLPATKAYVAGRLREMGYAPREICESGLVACAQGASEGPCILLRADMDALQIPEQTELEFCSRNGAMHACGHDMHAAMLLGAADILKEFEAELGGTVKLVFQPDEEGFTGAKAMLKAGVLQDPAPQAGLALHVHSGTPSGLFLCGKGTTMAGCTLFRITVQGVGCHGAMPETGVDPILIAAHIHLALQEITARELPAKAPAVATIGKFSGGEAPNIIPQSAVLEGTIRTFDRELSAQILRRIGEISGQIAAAFRGTAVTEELASAPPLYNEPALAEQMAECAQQLFGSEMVYRMEEGGMGSEDFASYTYEIPCAYPPLGAGTAQENAAFGKPMHNAGVVFNEEILVKGAAMYAYGALKWLAEGRKANV